LAAILMTARTDHPFSVFGGAVVALSLVTLIGVLVGEGLVTIIPQVLLKKGAALVFVLIGLWMFFSK
jgi:putative Ca2+/H+ antiporter (TMEM165/GDT1 family)